MGPERSTLSVSRDPSVSGRSKDDLRAYLLKQFRIDYTVEEIFEEVDANGDGEISLDEWLQALKLSPTLRLWAASIEVPFS